MKKAFILAGFLIISSSCFAIEEYYYAEYSFNETSEINSSSLNYSFVAHRTKADLQAETGEGLGQEYAGYVRRIPRAGSDKRIFIIERYRLSASEPYRAWSVLFIKINENEYLWFFSGQ